MTTNSFNPQEVNLQIQPLPTYIDSDGSFKINTPMLSTYNFDGMIPKKQEPISVTEVKPGYLVQIVSGGDYYPVVSVEKDDLDLENTGFVTLNYINSLGNTASEDYLISDTIEAIYEDWNEKILGSQGWGITAGGNAIFTNVAVRGRIEAEEGYISGNLTIGSGGSTTLNDVATTDDLTGFVTAPQLQDNVTIISGGNIQTGTISAITFQTNLSGRRSKLGVGNAYVPTNWNTTIVPRSGGAPGSTTYSTTGLEFFDQNNARTGYMYSADRYNSGVFQPVQRLLIIGSTDQSGNDTGNEIIVGHNFLRLYGSGLPLDLEGNQGVRLFSNAPNNGPSTAITAGAFGSGEITLEADSEINIFTSSVDFFANVFVRPGYKYYGDGSGLTNLPAPANVALTTSTYSDPAWITSLAGTKITGTVDNSRRIGADRIASGTGTVNLSSANNGTTNISFGITFTTTPIVVATSFSDQRYYAFVNGATTTGATIGVAHRDGTAITTNVSVRWIAIGSAN